MRSTIPVHERPLLCAGTRVSVRRLEDWAMSNLRRALATGAAIALAGSLGTASLVAGGGVVASATGSGTYLLLGTAPASFELGGVQLANGNAAGSFRHEVDVQGFHVAFEGTVTCLTMDPVNHRAWIGGVITLNNSTHPSYTTPRTQVGHDIWFRVVDYGEGAAAAADRTSFVGFEGDLDFPSSAAYCAGQPWAAADARTWGFSEGNVQVHD